MNDIVAPDHARIARKFRALVATYEANRDLVLMGAYRQGADPQLDRAIAMHERLTAFLAQPRKRSCLPTALPSSWR
jgi:flagellum-specific ATP synthase